MINLVYLSIGDYIQYQHGHLKELTLNGINTGLIIKRYLAMEILKETKFITTTKKSMEKILPIWILPHCLKHKIKMLQNGLIYLLNLGLDMQY